MEGNKQGGSSSSSSSFISDLFGSKESAPRGSFGSIFAPESKAQRRESMRYHSFVERNQDYFKQESNSKTPADNNTFTGEEEKRSTTTNKFKSSYYQEQKLQPCPLSSSIYYGGQDVYTYPQNSQDSSYSTGNSRYSSYNIDEEDDSGSASRGNWWQGSLYY